jgi:hypothetical protein
MLSGLESFKIDAGSADERVELFDAVHNIVDMFWSSRMKVRA